MVLLDAVVRLLPGVMGNADSGASESFEDGLLEYPAIHAAAALGGPRRSPRCSPPATTASIADGGEAEAERLTRERRPDLAGKPSRD